MSVDLEDYFCDLPINEWSKYKSRILETTDILLNLFEETNTKATFFVVGYFAEKFPELIKKIHDQGHEIGSHTFSHIDLRTTSKNNIEIGKNKITQKENFELSQNFGFFNFIYIYLLISF